MWVVLVSVAILGSIGVRWLPEKAEGRPVKGGDVAE